MSAIVFISDQDDPVRWREALQPEMGEMDFSRDFRIWPDIGTPDDIDAALVWRPEPGSLKSLPNLKVIINLGAGVDAILEDSTWPRDVPLVRMIDPSLTRHMTEFIVHRVLHFHRKFHVYDKFQASRTWKELPQDDTLTKRVGILGLGELGADAARLLVPFGFKMAGWSRSEKKMDGVESFSGKEGLVPFLNRTDILVCLLPLTPQTEGIINAETLHHLPADSYIINAARGGHVVENDLLDALDSGHIAGAALDVFHNEPLPEDSPFWAHPKVLLTPHIASLSVPASAAKDIARTIRRMRNGDALDNLVDLEAGY